jgi:hypothetical protein
MKVKRKVFQIIVILLCLSSQLYADNADIDITGALRNDAFLTKYKDDSEYGDILEAKIILQKKTDKWNLYIDGRAYLYYGYITEVLGTSDAKLMRGFIRYFTEMGDFTLGKTYINFGNPGIFNPFELDKSVNLSDLSYTKEGIIALEYVFPLGELSGVKAYAGHDSRISNYTTGLSLYSNAGNFDFGVVANRKGPKKITAENEDLANQTQENDDVGKNSGGFYLKGDLGVGVQGAYCYHIDDRKDGFSEANLGIDYSFLDGHLILNAILYYNQSGADNTEEYQLTAEGDTYFLAKYYVYGNIIYIFDEFLSADIGCFANLNDKSTIVIPKLIIVIANGLTMTLQGAYITGTGNQEFSQDLLGQYSILLRVEAKF